MGLIKDFFLSKIFNSNFMFGLITGNFVLIENQLKHKKKSLSLFNDVNCNFTVPLTRCFALVVLLSLFLSTDFALILC